MIAAIYARKSTQQSGRAEEERSVATQIELARAYAGRHGWTIAEEHVYVEKDGSSGAEFENRDQFMALVAALKPRAAPFDVLILYDKDRLGREQWEMAYYLKKLDQAGVRIHETRDTGGALRFDSPTDRMMMSMLAGVADLEREKTRIRTRDALRRKAERSYVTGGACFGYENVTIADEAGRRSHVIRRIVEDEATVVRRLFELAADGCGLRAIAHRLNDEGALAPAPRRAAGPRGWAPSSVREVLHRELYRGLIVWGRKRKRDQWGQHRVTSRAEAEWIRHRDESLRIVPEELWCAAHERIDGTRQAYLRGTSGRLWGRPANGQESRYLLTGLTHCGACGGTMEVRSRDWGRRRRFFYACTSYHRRGTSVCRNLLELPLDVGDRLVLDAIEEEVLHPEVIEGALREALDVLRRPATLEAEREAALKQELRTVEAQLGNLTAAVKLGGSLPSLVAELQALERRRGEIQRTLKPAPATPADAAKLRKLVAGWRAMFRDNLGISRQILRTLFTERGVWTPRVEGDRRFYEFRAVCSLGKVFTGLAIPQMLVTPAGFEPAISTLKGLRPRPG